MLVLLVFSFISGLVTIAAPCIWPLLPIVLSASSTGGHRKPLGITVGIMVSFALFTLTISYIVKIIPFDPNILRLFAVVVIGFLGLTLIIPRLNHMLEGWVSRLSGRFAPTSAGSKDGFWGGVVAGVALGLVWTPCAGPILATIATLAATRQVNAQLLLVTITYVVGVGIPLFVFSVLGRRIFTKSRALSSHLQQVQQIFGIIMIVTALAIYTNYDKVVQAELLNAFPSYSTFLNQLEGSTSVQKQLDAIKGNENGTQQNQEHVDMPFPSANKLPMLGRAPEFVGITNWLNLPDGKEKLTLSDMKGKVVLVDFWTYTCINCIRTLPYVTSWYDKYKDQGFVVVGVHTPEFEFEKKTNNVLSAIDQYNIHYPVAQDNDYHTWNAYNNRYWPAEYLIDRNGVIRRTHFGEGEYDQTEMAIKDLLKEAGETVDTSTVNVQDQTPSGPQTPETYLGLKRLERFGSDQQPVQGVSNYTITTDLPQNYVGFEGTWDLSDEYAKSLVGSSLQLHFVAGKVFLVITPKTSRDIVRVYLDGAPIADTSAGADVRSGVVTVTESRLYELVNLKGKTEDHVLKLQFETPGTEGFAFTFG